MLMPSVLILIGIMVPFCIGVFNSMTDKKLYEESFRFVFLGNYLHHFVDATFLKCLLNTAIYTVVAVGIQIVLGMLVTLLLDIESRMQKILRVILILPLLIPPVVSSLMWKTMLQPSSGVINYLLTAAGLPSNSFLTGTGTALMTVIFMDVWVYLPFTVLILLSGIQSMPQDMIEAARIDGASGTKIFFYLKLPYMKKYIILTLLFRICDSLKAFELIYSTTKGGPLNATRTLNIEAYEQAFKWSNIGEAMSVIFTLWIIAYIISSFLMKKWNASNND